MTLYEITGALQELQEMIENGEFTEADLEDTMEAVEGELEVKADGYAKVMRSLEADASAIDAEVKRLNERKSSIKRGIEQMKKRLYDSMKATGNTKFKTELFSFNIRKNGGKQPLKITGDIIDIPGDFIITTAAPNKEAIREALEAGQELPFAILEERGESLVIK